MAASVDDSITVVNFIYSAKHEEFNRREDLDKLLKFVATSLLSNL
jgi:hypothetical protein